MTPQKAENKVQSLLEKTVSKNKDLEHGVLLIHSDKLNIHWKFAYGTVDKGTNPIKEETFDKWEDWAEFGKGIDYGYGLVSLKFKEMMFLLSDKLSMWGNWGSTSTYMFYNPVYDIYVIGAFNQTNFVKKQVQFMIKVTTIISKAEK